MVMNTKVCYNTYVKGGVSMSFASYLSGIRKDNKITQVGMAEILDISVTAIKLIETGSTKFPSDKVLANLARFLNIRDIDVIMGILFNEEVSRAHENYLGFRYISYMYLQGYNVDQAPYIYQVFGKVTRDFDGRLIKKRDNKNIVLVTNYEKYLYRIEEINDDRDAHEYISDLISLALSVLDDYKYLHILFDANNTEHRRVFNLIKEIRIKKWSFDLYAVLFDAIEGQVVEEELITIK